MIKRISFLLLFLSITLSGFNQSKNIQNAYNAYKQTDRDGVRTDLKKAKEYIDLAFEHESTSNEAKMWNYRSKIYLEITLNQPELDKDAVFKATEAHIRCLDRDKKGRFAVRKWTSEDEVLDGLVKCGFNLFNSGVDDYNNGKYENAIKKYEEIFKLIPLDKNDHLKRANIVPQSIYNNLFLASLRLEDTESQIKYLKKSIDLNVNDPQIYINLSNIYSKQGDFDKALNYIKLGQDMFDSDMTLINTEIDLLMKMGKSEVEIIEKLSEAIDLDNFNELLFIIRSQMYVSIGSLNEAEKDLLNALELDPSSSIIYNNLASLYLSMTEPIVDELNKTDYRKKSKVTELENEIESLHKKALPHLEEYISIKESKGEQDKSALNTLATIYYSLGMETKSIETRNKIKD